jgi:hypothetical protein
MPVLKNPKHERFAVELANGSTKTEAHKRAGYLGDRTAASHLSTRLDIRERVEEIRCGIAARVVASHEVTLEGLLKEAAEIQSAAFAAGQFAAANNALIARAKLALLWVERSERTVLDRRDLSDYTDEELLKMIQEETKKPDDVTLQ